MSLTSRALVLTKDSMTSASVLRTLICSVDAMNRENANEKSCVLRDELVCF